MTAEICTVLISCPLIICVRQCSNKLHRTARHSHLFRHIPVRTRMKTDRASGHRMVAVSMPRHPIDLAKIKNPRALKLTCRQKNASAPVRAQQTRRTEFLILSTGFRPDRPAKPLHPRLLPNGALRQASTSPHCHFNTPGSRPMSSPGKTVLSSAPRSSPVSPRMIQAAGARTSPVGNRSRPSYKSVSVSPGQSPNT